METLKTLIMLTGILRGFSWGGSDQRQHGYAVNIVGMNAYNSLIFERFELTYAIYRHPGPEFFFKQRISGETPWRRKPHIAPGVIEAVPQ